MTPAEQLEFFREQAESSGQWAAKHLSDRRWAVGIQVSGSAAKNHFTRALIGWRTGLLDPAHDLREALRVSEDTVQILRSADVGPLRGAFNSIPGAYSAILLDRPDALVVDELRQYATGPKRRGLAPDQPLDAKLVGELTAVGPTDGYQAADTLSRLRRTALVGATFVTYFGLVATDRTDHGQAAQLTKRAIEDFARRRSDSFFIGSYSYEGGEFYNDLVIDFRLAAIWRVRGWAPSGLSDAERVHVELPARR